MERYGRDQSGVFGSAAEYADPEGNNMEQGQPVATSPPPPGLSEFDIAKLERRRRDLIEGLTISPSGRALVRQADPQIHSVGAALAGDIKALGKVAQRNEVEGDDFLRSKSAAIVLNELTLLCHEQATHDLYAHRSRMYILAQKAHSWMDDLMDRRIRSRSPVESIPTKRFLAKHWGWTSNLFTILAAAALLFFSSFAVAAALIGLRIIVTALVWSIASYPSDDSPKKPVLDSDPRICALGHGGDLFLFASFGMALINNDHRPAGFLVMAAGSMMILGTLMRISASATGFPVPRLHLERMVRGGSTLAAIYLAAVPSIAWWWSAIVIILFPMVFAFIESQEAWRAFALGRKSLRKPVPPAAGQVVETTSEFISS